MTLQIPVAAYAFIRTSTINWFLNLQARCSNSYIWIILLIWHSVRLVKRGLCQGGKSSAIQDSSDWNHFGLHRIREKIAPNGIDVSACVGVTHSEPDIGLKTFYWLSYPGTRKLHTKTVCKSRYQLVLGFNACRNNSSVIRGSTEPFVLQVTGLFGYSHPWMESYKHVDLGNQIGQACHRLLFFYDFGNILRQLGILTRV